MLWPSSARRTELILEENYGKVYPYCLVDLDDQNRRTSSVQCASVNPSWQEDLTFEVSVQQWVLSNLRIQVCTTGPCCVWHAVRACAGGGGGGKGACVRACAAVLFLFTINRRMSYCFVFFQDGIRSSLSWGCRKVPCWFLIL